MKLSMLVISFKQFYFLHSSEIPHLTSFDIFCLVILKTQHTVCHCIFMKNKEYLLVLRCVMHKSRNIYEFHTSCSTSFDLMRHTVAGVLS